LDGSIVAIVRLRYTTGEGSSGMKGEGGIGVQEAPADTTVAEFRVSLLGQFELTDGQRLLAVPGVAQRLIALLALAGVAVKRSVAACTLWPGATESHAFGNLRSALSRLASGRRAVRADAFDLELRPTVDVDLRAAKTLALRLLSTSCPAPTDLTPRALGFLSADLLPGWYDDWVLVEAEEWRQLRLHALEALADHLTAAQRFGEAAVAAGASVRADPFRESAHATLIRVHLAEGNRREALRQLERLRRILAAELGVKPSRRITELFEDLEDV
jgi:DNA-binding SARP family transcriptional activator